VGLRGLEDMGRGLLTLLLLVFSLALLTYLDAAGAVDLDMPLATKSYRCFKRFNTSC